MAIHTLLLITPPEKHRVFQALQRRIFDLGRLGQYRVFEKPASKGKLIYAKSLNRPGVLILYYNGEFPRLEFRVNPSVLLGGEYTDLWQADSMAIKQLKHGVDEVLREIGLRRKFGSLLLHRIDCTQDVCFPSNDAVDEYLSCMKQSPTLRDYKAINYPESYPNYKELNQHSFRMMCNEICISAYNKSYQLQEQLLVDEDKIPPNVLRFEVAINRAAFRRVIAQHGCVLSNDAGHQIIQFSHLSGKLLCQYFGRAILIGQFLRGDLALQAVEDSCFSPKIKKRMKDVLHAVSRCHQTGFSGAKKALEKDGMTTSQWNYLRQCFEALELNPATIRGKSGYTAFPGVVELLLGAPVLFPSCDAL